MVLQVGLVITIGGCCYVESLDLAHSIKHNKYDCVGAPELDVLGAIVFNPLKEANNNSSAIKVLTASCSSCLKTKRSGWRRPCKVGSLIEER